VSGRTAIEIREITPGETALAHDAMRALRPAHEDLAAFVERIDRLQRPEGYRLVGAFATDGGRAAALAVAGFRTGHNLAWGHFLYVDDLSTAPEARRRGAAGALLEWLLAEAHRLGCDELHLDSGTSANRFDAHRLYMNHRLVITSHHFAREV
jgi:GNAT superfamily N-acetyltransferase